MKTPVKILLIEDNPADARLVREWLKEAGAEQFHLEHAERLDAGLKLLTEKGFDAVLLDLGLPDSQGLGALQAVRTQAPATPVVVLTGLSDEAVGMKAVQEGAQDYLIKGEIQESHLIRSLHYARERRRMEGALQAERANLDAVFESAPVAMLVLDETTNIVMANVAAVVLAGGSKSEILQHRPGNALRCIHSSKDPRGCGYAPDCRLCPARNGIESLIANGGVIHGAEIPLVLIRNGEPRKAWLRMGAEPIQINGCRHLCVSMEDLTERRGLEEAVRESHEFESNVLASMSDGLSVLDPAGIHLEVNPALCRMTGFSREDLVGTGPPHPYWPPEEYDEINRAFERTLQGEPGPFDLTFLKKDGTRFPVLVSPSTVCDQDGKAVSYMATVRDITERRRSEEALRRSEAFTRAVITRSPVGITVRDREGSLVLYNEAWKDLWALTDQEIEEGEKRDAGLSFDERYVHLRPWSQEAGKVFESGGEYYVPEVETRSMKPAAAQWISIRWYALKSGSGEVQQVVTLTEDITKRKSLEEQLLQAQKMEAVGRLAGGVAHDFNNLLTAIMGYSELALDALPEDHPEHSHIEEIRNAGEQAAALTRQLLAFSRKQIFEPEVLCLNEVVSGMTKMLKRMIPENVELVAVLDPGLERVKLDPTQMEQVLLNLAVNARDAMPQGGKLTLETANVELDAAYAKSHPEVQPGHYVMLAVSDTGCGMDEATQARIFEPFFTTKEKSKGTGLGLSTVYGIVKQSGGSIFVYSEPGKGTAFKIYLPRAAEVPGERGPVAEKRPVPALPQGAETVLVAEDDETLRRLIYEILQSSGYAVLEAGRGEEALRLAGEHAGPIHLLITDMVMPGMGGREVAGRLAALRPGTRVLFVSGYTDDAVVRHGVLEHGLAFLQKPFVPEALLRKVREVLDGPEGPRV